MLNDYANIDGYKDAWAQPVIIIVNPSSPIDESTAAALACMVDHLHFAADLRAVREVILRADVRRRFVITSVTDVKELDRVLSTIDHHNSANYVILVGPQAQGDTSLAALLDMKELHGK